MYITIAAGCLVIPAMSCIIAMVVIPKKSYVWALSEAGRKFIACGVADYFICLQAAIVIYHLTKNVGIALGISVVISTCICISVICLFNKFCKGSHTTNGEIGKMFNPSIDKYKNYKTYSATGNGSNGKIIRGGWIKSMDTVQKIINRDFPGENLKVAKASVVYIDGEYIDEMPPGEKIARGIGWDCVVSASFKNDGTLIHNFEEMAILVKIKKEG